MTLPFNASDTLAALVYARTSLCRPAPPRSRAAGAVRIGFVPCPVRQQVEDWRLLLPVALEPVVAVLRKAGNIQDAELTVDVLWVSRLSLVLRVRVQDKKRSTGQVRRSESISLWIMISLWP